MVPAEVFLPWAFHTMPTLGHDPVAYGEQCPRYMYALRGLLADLTYACGGRCLVTVSTLVKLQPQLAAKQLVKLYTDQREVYGDEDGMVSKDEVEGGAGKVQAALGKKVSDLVTFIRPSHTCGVDYLHFNCPNAH